MNTALTHTQPPARPRTLPGSRLRGHSSTITGGYTLIEVLIAAIVIAMGLAAAVSMSATMMLQEELSWRVTVALNYQENAARLWQLGLSPVEVTALMPATGGNPFLNEILATNGTTTEFGSGTVDSLATLEVATHTVQVENFASAAAPGGTTTVNLYRPVTR